MNSLNNFKDEFVEGEFIHSEEKAVPSTLLDLTDALKEIHGSLQKHLRSGAESN